MQLGKAKLILPIPYLFRYIYIIVLLWPKVFNDGQGNFSSFFQRKRLEGRGTETKESLQKRLDTAQEALEYGRVLFSILIFPEKLLHELLLAWYLPVSYK